MGLAWSMAPVRPLPPVGSSCSQVIRDKASNISAGYGFAKFVGEWVEGNGVQTHMCIQERKRILPSWQALDPLLDGHVLWLLQLLLCHMRSSVPSVALVP